jgi:hypothetical protein
MSVNSFSSVINNRRLRLVAGIVSAIGVVFFLAAFVTDKTDETAMARRLNIAVRSVGHHLLLRTGDSTSALRPVIEKGDGIFLLQFDREFAFQPDSLVTIAKRVLNRTGLSHYTVTVHECGSPAIVYGFEINPPANSIVSCQGRHQRKACYTIEIAFADFPGNPVLNSPLTMMLGVMLSIVAVALITRRPVSSTAEPTTKPVPIPTEDIVTDTIGRFTFDRKQQRLVIDDETIPLTDKESRILTLLSKNFGELTLRDELIQEVWTEEGVITGRSLDMFISKLRKKLSADPDLRITNVHGKGYRLEKAGASN